MANVFHGVPLISIYVAGEAVTQGSMRVVPVPRAHHGPKHKMLHDRHEALLDWRKHIGWIAALDMKTQPVASLVRVELTFTLPPTKRRQLLDIDKLSRAVLDALKGIVYLDDKQVCELLAVRAHDADGDSEPGVRVVVRERVGR